MIIDEKGAKAISKWFKDDIDDTTYCLTIDNPVIIKTKNVQEFATMKILLAKNNIKYKLCNDDIKNISDN